MEKKKDSRAKTHSVPTDVYITSMSGAGRGTAPVTPCCRPPPLLLFPVSVISRNGTFLPQHRCSGPQTSDGLKPFWISIGSCSSTPASESRYCFPSETPRHSGPPPAPTARHDDLPATRGHRCWWWSDPWRWSPISQVMDLTPSEARVRSALLDL